MTLHDAAMTRFRQWWLRTKRAGHAYAEGFAMHHTPHRFNLRACRSILAWGGVLPLVILLLIVTWHPVFAALFMLLYPALAMKIFLRMRQTHPPRDAALYAAFTVLGKLPQFVGMLAYAFNRFTHRRTRLIEYKTAHA
jgi:hypothetical protein